MRKPNLGKRLKMGDTFVTDTKKMLKFPAMKGYQNFKLLSKGTEAYFTKGNRRYFCVVLALIRSETGINVWPTIQRQNITKYNTHKDLLKVGKGVRWYRFSYLVRVLIN